MAAVFIGALGSCDDLPSAEGCDKHVSFDLYKPEDFNEYLLEYSQVNKDRRNGAYYNLNTASYAAEIDGWKISNAFDEGPIEWSITKKQKMELIARIRDYSFVNRSIEAKTTLRCVDIINLNTLFEERGA